MRLDFAIRYFLICFLATTLTHVLFATGLRPPAAGGAPRLHHRRDARALARECKRTGGCIPPRALRAARHLIRLLPDSTTAAAKEASLLNNDHERENRTRNDVPAPQRQLQVFGLDGLRNLFNFLGGAAAPEPEVPPFADDQLDALEGGAAVRETAASAPLSYAAGDISPSYASRILNPASLNDFNGVWRIILSRSEPIEDVLTALGIPALKRRFMVSHEGSTEILVAPNHESVYMRNYLPAGRVVAARVPLDGERFFYEEPDTGVWKTQAKFTNNRLVQVRHGRAGVMYDVRVLFPTDPQGTLPGPLMLFKWTFIPKATGVPVSANRWLRKSTASVQQ